MRLFKRYYTRPDDDNAIIDVCTCVDYHALSVELLAKTLQALPNTGTSFLLAQLNLQGIDIPQQQPVWTDYAQKEIHLNKCLLAAFTMGKLYEEKTIHPLFRFFCLMPYQYIPYNLILQITQTPNNAAEDLLLSQLKQLTNLENLNFIWILSIEENQILDNLNGLDSVTEFAYLQISQNPSLESISALQKVNRIRVQTSLIDNAKLTNIDALSKTDMMSMDSLVIVANPILDVCAIESICAYLADTTHAARILGNGTFCDNRDQVEMECLLLPLELISFEAIENTGTNSVTLRWTTAHEKNIKSIEIEHRTNSKAWHKLSGKIELAKSPNSQNNYQFKHNSPEKTKNYYRLKINEQSGAFSYSGLKIIDFTSKKSNISYTINNDQILINSSQDEPSYLDIHDIYGRRVFFQEILNKACEIDLSPLKSGFYILNVYSNQKSIFTQKFIR